MGICTVIAIFTRFFTKTLRLLSKYGYGASKLLKCWSGWHYFILLIFVLASRKKLFLLFVLMPPLARCSGTYVFISIGPMVWELWQFDNLTLIFRGQGHDGYQRSWPISIEIVPMVQLVLVSSLSGQRFWSYGCLKILPLIFKGQGQGHGRNCSCVSCPGPTLSIGYDFAFIR